jgi:PPM family protein phosphatase
MTISAVASTDVGRARNRNEDAFLIDDAASLYAIADGMGGHAAGDVASQTAIAAFGAAFRDTRSMLAALKAANRAVHERSARERALTGMGTTLTGLHIFGNTAFVAHVGDSRLYRLRDAALEQLTTDHTVAQDMIAQGTLTKNAAMRHPLSSMLKRSLGMRPDVDVDVFQTDVAKGDVFMLCSDGLTGMVTDEDVRATMLEEMAPANIASRLVEAANLRGGHDNITVVLVGIH